MVSLADAFGAHMAPQATFADYRAVNQWVCRRALLVDHGYDANKTVEVAVSAGMQVVIPPKKNGNPLFTKFNYYNGFEFAAQNIGENSRRARSRMNPQ